MNFIKLRINHRDLRPSHGSNSLLGILRNVIKKIGENYFVLGDAQEVHELSKEFSQIFNHFTGRNSPHLVFTNKSFPLINPTRRSLIKILPSKIISTIKARFVGVLKDINSSPPMSIITKKELLSVSFRLLRLWLLRYL